MHPKDGMDPLNWVYTISPDLSVKKLRTITVCVQNRSVSTHWTLLPLQTGCVHLLFKGCLVHLTFIYLFITDKPVLNASIFRTLSSCLRVFPDESGFPPDVFLSQGFPGCLPVSGFSRMSQSFLVIYRESQTPNMMSGIP